MSSITTDQGIVHYEVYGRGRPVILLHGWLGSWGLWQETMSFLGQHYRTYALDFWGFGESGKKRETYAVQDFVSLVGQFMEQLGIARTLLTTITTGLVAMLALAGGLAFGLGGQDYAKKFLKKLSDDIGARE